MGEVVSKLKAPNILTTISMARFQGRHLADFVETKRDIKYITARPVIYNDDEFLYVKIHQISWRG